MKLSIVSTELATFDLSAKTAYTALAITVPGTQIVPLYTNTSPALATLVLTSYRVSKYILDTLAYTL